MCHVTIVELLTLIFLLDFLFIYIIQYKKYKIRDISQFSFLAKFFLNDPRPLGLSKDENVNVSDNKTSFKVMT